MTDTILQTMQDSLETEPQMLSPRTQNADLSAVLEAVDRPIRASFVMPAASGTSGIGELDLGGLGYVDFGDWDQIRDRDRDAQVQIIEQRG